MLTFSAYQRFAADFAVDRELIRGCMAACEPLVIEALSVYAQRALWRGSLPVYPRLTTPQDNGGWGHLMPLWFQPHERPVPFHTLDNWGLFALVYRASFGDSPEAQELAARVFHVQNLVRLVAGADMLIPFLPSTQGQGYFFRHGMLPFLLSILWFDEPARTDWLRLHELGARRFVQERQLAVHPDPITWLAEREFAIFARLERNSIHHDREVAAFLSDTSPDSLLHLYRDLFGALNLGVTALAHHYQPKPLDAWRTWFYQEISFPYRLPEYAADAITAFLNQAHE